jgi:HTH-type transcriptional regulator / antitoxin HigA
MGSQVGTPAGDELDVLATLVDAWEARNHPIDPPDPLMAIQFRMEQQGLTRSDLEPMIGSRARVSEVLTGKRKLTIEMIRRIRAGLGISADLLIESSIVARAARGGCQKMAHSSRQRNPARRTSVQGSAHRSSSH